MNGELILVEDVAETFTYLICQKVRDNPQLTFVTSGGPTAKACYTRLAQHALTNSIDFSQIRVLLTDERCNAPDQDKNSVMVYQTLITPLSIRNFYPLSCEDTKEYEALLKHTFIDIIHLGLGPDGHTASLFPGLTNYRDPKGFLYTSDPSGLNPYNRISLSLDTINSAELGVFTVSGTTKHKAIKAITDNMKLPAAMVQTKTLLWILDKEAFYGLPK